MGSLSSKPKPPKPLPAPTVMPVADDEAIQNAKRRNLAAMVKRSGRASTFLSDNNTDSSTLG